MERRAANYQHSTLNQSPGVTLALDSGTITYKQTDIHVPHSATAAKRGTEMKKDYVYVYVYVYVCVCVCA